MRRMQERREARIVDFNSSEEDNAQAVKYQAWHQEGM
jgi:hypothetical protein